MLTFEPYGTSRTYGARASGTYDLSALFGVSSQPWDVEGSPHPSTCHCLDLDHGGPFADKTSVPLALAGGPAELC
ncbi:hypothetical protein PCANC_18169 [Puccinia coronata f. sp. avenae]|uniref:Uncharacterized protein n=1 Tax=Puccinia coronata f. sp. avenae TaxID=200324 RepID=A0A2N5SNL7_9BASI|nr:hypothetical protein PCANC_18169 [Puccinia coronata f. sp. avenae]